MSHGLANAQTVSVWRYGVARPEVWSALRDNPPQDLYYEVQPGDILSDLAHQWHTSSNAIANMNGLTDPDLIQIGQRLVIPR